MLCVSQRRCEVSQQDEKVVMIDGWVIKQDAEGLYCLNDVHKAAGGTAKHQVTNWVRSDEAQALVAELEPQKRGTNTLYIRKGRGVTGTYAGRRGSCLPLVLQRVHQALVWTSAELKACGDEPSVTPW